jgi:hypothetical protein
MAPSNVPYEHDKAWGDGNGFSHVGAALMKPDVTIPVVPALNLQQTSSVSGLPQGLADKLREAR